MQLISRNNIRKIIIILLMVCLIVVLNVKTDTLAQQDPRFSKQLNIQEGSTYELIFNYSIDLYSIEDILSITTVNDKAKEVDYEPIIQQLDKSIILDFSNWTDDIHMVEVEVLANLSSKEYEWAQGNIIQFTNIKEPNHIEANFYIENGLVGIKWQEQENVIYEVYSLQQPQDKLKDIPEGGELITETSHTNVLLSNSTELNKNLKLSYFVVAKEHGEIVSVSNILSTSTLANRVPITIIDSIPKEITSLQDFPAFITAEMFGGMITELPVYYEQLDNGTMTYTIINTPIINEQVTITSNVYEEVYEEFVYRQMMYPTYFSDENNRLIVQEDMVRVEVIPRNEETVINLNNLLFPTPKDEELNYLTMMLKEKNSVINLSSYHTLWNETTLQEVLNVIAQTEGFFYDIHYFGFNKDNNELYIIYNDEVESRQLINERIIEVAGKLDGSLESIYEFLVTDYIFTNQSSQLTAYAFLMLAEQFDYDVSVVKVTEHGTTTYWNKVVIDNENYYIDVSKNIMTTGVANDIFMVKQSDLVKYGVQSY